MALLSTSSKIKKSDKFTDKFLSKILYLSPVTLSGYQVCPHASAGCAAACLNTSGMGVYSNVQEARKKKTRRFFEERQIFLKELQWEIACFAKLCAKLGKIPVIRLNGTSDLPWEKMTTIIQDNPSVQFYDYTKSFPRMMAFLRGETPPNYHLTFSMSETNFETCLQVLKCGGNVAMVFDIKNVTRKDRKFPEQFLGYKIVDGDKHDLRFLDQKNRGQIVGLWAKGKARKDDSGFVILIH
jgi:hypothetical protein